jgi:hypothetical protein
MSATMHIPEFVDNLAAEMSDRAFRVASRHGVRGNSVDLELEMWEALRRELKRPGKCPSLLQDSSARPRTDACLATLADRVYQVALNQGLDGYFVDLQLDLWNEFQNMTQRTTN